MRMLVFFDLPVVTAVEQREYRKFRKFLINEGFIMMQESVYCKIALNNSILNSVMGRINKNKPPNGIVQILTITEKQFSSIEYIVGKKDCIVEDSESRLIIL